MKKKKNKTRLQKTDNNREYKIAARLGTLRCSICPPNKGENASRKPKHGVKKPKHKDKRK